MIFIPYRDLVDFGERIEFVLGEVAAGIEAIFAKYGGDFSGVRGCANEMIALAKQSPLDYVYPTR